MEQLILINFNSYLGGGETLMVRYSKFLKENGVDFLCFCLEESYIKKDLLKSKIGTQEIRSFSFNPDYYYLNENDRSRLIRNLSKNIDNNKKIKFVTFCMRDLYIASQLSESTPNSSVSHLVLHVQDSLYLGQNVFDKAFQKFFGKRKFNSKSSIKLNLKLLNKINRKEGLISMADVISKSWKKDYNISIPLERLVPLPSFKETLMGFTDKSSLKKILWVGRIVDFKIPSLISMLKFIVNFPDFSLTIVGDGDKESISNFVRKNSIEDRVNFIGEIPYGKLPSVILEHSIGYAMGTSLVELAKYKIPVIVALASYDHQLFKRDICGGIFYDKSLGCDGSDLLMTSESEIKYTIQNCVSQIQDDYIEKAKKCYDFAKENYSEDINFLKYIHIIRYTKIFNDDEDIVITKVPKLRKFLYNIFKNDKNNL